MQFLVGPQTKSISLQWKLMLFYCISSTDYSPVIMTMVLLLWHKKSFFVCKINTCTHIAVFCAWNGTTKPSKIKSYSFWNFRQKNPKLIKHNKSVINRIGLKTPWRALGNSLKANTATIFCPRSYGYQIKNSLSQFNIGKLCLKPQVLTNHLIRNS